MKTTCFKDGWEMIPVRVQIVRPECEVRIWLSCVNPKCDNQIVHTYTYPVGNKIDLIDIED